MSLSAFEHPDDLAFLAGGGAMGARMRAHDWSATPLGPPHGWPQSLRSIVSVCLNSPMLGAVLWGPDLVFLYNDAYVPSLLDRHPDALGRPVAEVWDGAWEQVSAPFYEAMETGRGFSSVDVEVMIRRNDRLERTRWDFTAAPIRGEDGRIAGLFNQGIETTGRARAERRQAFRLAIEEQVRGHVDPGEIIAMAAQAFGRHLGVGQVLYGVVDPAAESVTIQREWNDGAFPAVAGHHRLDDYGAAFAADLRRGRSVVIGDVRDDARTSAAAPLALFQALSIAASITAPLIKDGRLVALFAVHSDTPRHWTADEVAFAEEVAERIWAAAENARVQCLLRESEERARRIVEGVRDYSVFVTDPAGVIVDWTPGAEAVFGWSAAEIVGASADILFTPEDRAAGVPARELETVRAHGCAADERWHLRRDGTRFFADGSVRPLHGEDGEVSGFIKIARDETERRAADAALRASEARYRSLFTSLDAGFCVVEVKFDADRRPIDYRFIEVNPAFEQQTGHAGAQGQWARTLIPGLEQHWIDAYGRVALTREAVRFENGSVALDRWYDVHAFPIGAREEGKVAIVFNDISDRRRAEERLRELNETLEAQVAERTADRDRMWRLSTDIMLVARFDGTINAVNPAWTSLLGWPESDLIGSNFMRLVHPDDRAATLAEMGTLGQGVTTFRFENRYCGADGVYRHISWTAVPGADLIHAVGRDVSAEKERQAELDAAHEQLRQSQKMEAMGQLTGGVAHDFNNLLTPIVGGLDMLQRRGVGGEREQRLIDGALQSADRAKTLVQRLLAFARRQPLQPSAVDVVSLVNGMADLVASTTGPQIKVVVDAPAGLPPARADPNQLEMAILNLSVNARDAMAEGGILRISAAAESTAGGHRAGLKPGAYVRLSVADTGSGMDEAVIARAIEPFFSTKGVGRGTGLGLSMVHGLASQLGGALGITSTLGLGTNVELWLPVADVPAQVAEAPAAGMSEASGAGLALLVDDEDLVRASTAAMLLDLGFDVTEARSAEQALRLLGEGLAPDILVTDHLMPEMNGTDLARRVLEDRPDMLVLVVSGYAESEGVAPDLPRLTKPFRQSDLAASLQDIAAL